MPSTIIKSAALFLLCLMLLGTGCSKSRSNNQFNTDTGKHASGWLPAGHMLSATAETAKLPASYSSAQTASSVSCADCHGADLSGGISGVSCTSCHLGGSFAIHPSTWTLLYRDHGPYADTNGTNACANQYCHGTTLGGVQNSGPSCTTCHSIPFTASSLICAACHGIPPDGKSFPNTAGAHAVHATSDTSTCTICHNGAGGMTTNSLHYNGVADVIFLTSYSAKSGSPAFSSSTSACSNVICHGGQTTPNWLTGTIDLTTSTGCSSCHAYGTSQYNSYNSGHHSFHLTGDVGAVCTDCHDTTKLATIHFANLTATTMTQAYLTMQSYLNYSGKGGGTFGTCTMTCHSEQHQSRQW